MDTIASPRSGGDDKGLVDLIDIKYTDGSRILGRIKEADCGVGTDGRGDGCPDALHHG